MVQCEHLGEKLVLDRVHAFFAILEWKMWEKAYLPTDNLKGKTVLDVGAGCGETAHLFLKHGAAKVIAIEANERCVKLLRENAETNRWNVEAICEPFEGNHLRKFVFDFMKVDIDGGEECLLDQDSLPPSVIETHGPLTLQFQRKFKMRLVWTVGNTILTNMS